MRIVFTAAGWDTYTHWQKSDRKVLNTINRLIDDIMRDDPFDGIGKPEPLRHNLSGTWSRRITDEHRLVYLVEDDDLIILSTRYHYE